MKEILKIEGLFFVESKQIACKKSVNSDTGIKLTNISGGG